MRTPQLAWLLAGFLTFLGQVRAQDFTVDGWTFDGSCRAHQDYITTGSEDALKMVTKAQSDLNLVLPRFEKKSNPRWTAQHQIFDVMALELQGPGVTLQFGNHVPLIICKDDAWTWVGADDLDPETPNLDSSDYDEETRVKLKEDFKMKNRHLEEFAQGYSGGWYYRQRMDWRKKAAQNPPGQPFNFQSKSINAGSPVGAQIPRDETKIGSFDASVSNTFVHEFTHWYGSANSGHGTERTVTLIDQQSLNKDGKWVYKNKDGQSVYRTRKHSEKTRKKNELIEDVTYGYKDVYNIAKTHDNGNGGPEYATETAEAYAFFAMMS
ncbi:Hypothetical protein NCS54_00420700 [Fusarium falciforme]|uniref:Hypothetical protein n=1 Tax=Fusarium falciforme TaxID=195108 RepID=UPI0023012DD4|nr:Hypothetical protein NCS54_00420700 [Fusarium falciforme]WAO86918.1 Hypothetical protein NCS54_00420700 [Fusarium falciforme]